MIMNPIESKEIRGLSLRTLITLIICTTTICSTVVGTYYGLKSDINSVKQKKDSDDRINEIRMKTLEVSNEVLRTQLDAVKNEIQVNRAMVEKLSK